MSLNKVMLIGNLGQDPEKRVTGSGQSVTSFSIATSERWTGKDGQKQEKTEWHRIVVWGPQADSCAQYLSKGRQVFVEGRLQTRQWDDKDGNKRYTTEIVANRVQFLGGAAGRAEGGSDFAPQAAASGGGMPGFDSGAGPDDVPF